MTGDGDLGRLAMPYIIALGILVSIVSGNILRPNRKQVITWVIKADLLFIGPAVNSYKSSCRCQAT